MKVMVELVLSHRSTIRERPTAEGFTHDWKMFVRCDAGNIRKIVKGVIFHLHESFPKYRRVVKGPPYSVKESSYTGFIMDIEIVFKNKEAPNRTVFQYDLFCQITGPTILNRCQKENIVFHNPSVAFAERLFKAGGVVVQDEQEEEEEESFHHAASSNDFIC